LPLFVQVRPALRGCLINPVRHKLFAKTVGSIQVGDVGCRRELSKNKSPELDFFNDSWGNDQKNNCSNECLKNET
jgi:hypothetical protein